MSSGSVGKGKQKEKSSERIQIPSFLQELLTGAAGTASGALSSAESLINEGDLVAPFTPAQEEAQRRGIAAADGELIGAAEDTLLGAAQGTDLSSFLSPAALQALTGSAAGGGDISGLLPPELLSVLTGTAGRVDPNLDALEGLADAELPPETLEALRSTAGGDFLFGGQGFDQAVQAAVDAARPGLIRTFGQAGAGGGTGALAHTAIGDSAIRAFSQRHGEERRNQLGAADRLAGLDIANRQLGSGIRRGIAGAGLDSSALLARLGETAEERSLESAGILGDLSNRERDRSIRAAEELPGIEAADINLLSGVGGQQQDQAQLEIDAPIMRQLELLSAALGGLPIEALLGRDRKGKSTRTEARLGFARK